MLIRPTIIFSMLFCFYWNSFFHSLFFIFLFVLNSFQIFTYLECNHKKNFFIICISLFALLISRILFHFILKWFIKRSCFIFTTIKFFHVLFIKFSCWIIYNYQGHDIKLFLVGNLILLWHASYLWMKIPNKQVWELNSWDEKWKMYAKHKWCQHPKRLLSFTV